MKFLNFFPRPREGVEEETTPPPKYIGTCVNCIRANGRRAY